MPRVRGLRRVLRAALGRAYPRIIGQNRERSWLFYDTILPLLGTIAFVYVYKALGAPDRFIGYVIMGGATTAFWMNVMWNMAAQFYWDKQGGNLELYMVVPCGITPILLGMSLGGFVATVLRAVAIVLIGSLMFHVRFDISNLGVFLLVFGVAVVALYGLGVTFASLFLLWGREAWHMAELFMEPVFLASGFYFPVRALGFWAAMGTSLIPLTLALDAMRQLLFGAAHPALLPVWWEVGGLVFLAVLFIILARFMLRRMEYLARREGRLSLRF
ncbi:MAG: ABC transporter [Armatimonadetes bacterium RBG_19FT_COMBO_69_19]|nr:MAG: ABC transporter [Armatimonadetes bacterium RBG_19FT_COMBO_69_19]